MGSGVSRGKLVVRFSVVSNATRAVLGETAVDDALAMHFSKEGTLGTRADWLAMPQPGAQPETIASASLPDSPGLEGAI